jgi:glycosyltransferase involved in cell wall biosynthesis
MKPYLLVTGDFVKTGGMDRANYALAHYLARQGGEVHLVTHRADPTLLEYGNVTCHMVPKVANSYFLSGFLLDRAGRSQAQKIQQRGGRVLVNGGNCQWGDINWVHYVHAAYHPESKINALQKLKQHLANHHFRKTERKNLQSARCVIANSLQTQSDLVSHCAVETKTIRSVYYGVDPSAFYPATEAERQRLRQQWGWGLDRQVVVFMGALGDRRKGFDTLFAAWQQLCATDSWDADLMVIGRGAELPQWQQRSQRAGLGDRIHFLGFRQDVPDLLRAADCLVAPTRYEAYGLGVHEALCCGLPAIVSAAAGVAEKYPTQLTDLLLSDPDNVEQLVQGLIRWRQAAQHYQQVAIALSETLRTYTWDAMAERILSVVEGEAAS